jgi:hypothetical protein
VIFFFRNAYLPDCSSHYFLYLGVPIRPVVDMRWER